MRVKVQYAVELEDVPKEVVKLLPSQLDLSPEVAVIEDLIYEGKMINAMEMIDDLRKLMYGFDQRLSDCQSILRGYLGITSQPPADALGESTEAESGSAS